jgi:hypothetical protein
VCVDDGEADVLCRVCGRWDYAIGHGALQDGATMDTIPESAASGAMDVARDHVGACVCGYDPDFPDKCPAASSRRKRRPNRARPPTDCNGLFTDAIVLSYGSFTLYGPLCVPVLTSSPCAVCCQVIAWI